MNRLIRSLKEKMVMRPSKVNYLSSFSKIYLHVPFMEKDKAKALGAKWDVERKKWYTLEGPKIGEFKRWHRVYVSDNFEIRPKEADATWCLTEKKWYTMGHSTLTDFNVALNTFASSDVTTASEPFDPKQNVVFFDIETNGLPDKTKPFKERFDSCRIVQMSYLMCNCGDLLGNSSVNSSVNTKEITADDVGDVLVQADEFKIENAHIHGISLEKSLSEGKPFITAIQEMSSLFLKSKYIIAHNAEFDLPVLKSELKRYKQKELLKHIENNMTIVCSMQRTKPLTKLLDKKGNPKNPSLKELYAFATNEEITNQHNAKYDVFNPYKAIGSLVENKHIKLDEFLVGKK